MDLDAVYRVAQSLTLQIDREGKLMASTSASRLAQVLGVEAIPVLQAFGGGGTPRRVMAKLAEEWAFDDQGFADVVEVLLAQGLLLGAGTDTPAREGGFASLQLQHLMVSDTVRVMAYRAAIAANAPGRSVLEIGCGTGILSVFAAQAGARRVVAIEETAIAGLAREMVQANGFEGIVEVVSGNSRDVTLDEPAELVIHEILGSDPFLENIVPYLQDARQRFLGPGGRLLPYRLEVLCAGIQVPEASEFPTKAQALREGRELAGLYGIDLSPYLRAMARAPEFSRAVSAGASRFAHPILSRECRLYDLDLASDLNGIGEPVSGSLEIETAGEMTSLVLYFRAHLDERIQLTNSPFAPRTHWGWMVRDLPRVVPVRPGDRVELTARVATVLGRQQLEVSLA